MGFTPLHVAASQGCKGILDSMIHHGAALNKQTKVYLRYVWSIFNNHPSPEIGLQHGNTPLHLACQNNEVETVEILINKGVDLNCLNSVRTTVFVDDTFLHIRSWHDSILSVPEITIADSHRRRNGTHGYLRTAASSRCEYRAKGTGKYRYYSLLVVSFCICFSKMI